MQIEHVTAPHREQRNAFVAQEPCFSPFQSWEWGEFKERLGWKAFRIAVKRGGHILAGAQMLVRSLIPGLASIAYTPRGPVGGWLGAEVADRLLAELHQVARSHRATLLRMEPPLGSDLVFDRILEQQHFRTSRHTNQPRATVILDLDRDLDDFLMQMRKKTGQCIRKAAGEGIIVRIGCRDDLPSFIRRHLHDAFLESGWGFCLSYPATLKFGIRLPSRLVRIDHIFHSDHSASRDTRVLKDSGGSDHRPVVRVLNLLNG